MAVDDAQGLHRRVHGCWSDEAEPTLAEVLDSAVDSAVLAGSSENFLGGRVLTGSYCQINAASDSPDCRNSSAARRVGDGRLDLAAVSHDPNVTEEPPQVALVERGDRLDVEAGEGAAKLSRLRRIVSHDKPLWKPSRQRFS